jgi:methyl coenzyme M reductase subunit C-like uncharacterized protein (methanogenesis marker protein 7)
MYTYIYTYIYLSNPNSNRYMCISLTLTTYISLHETHRSNQQNISKIHKRSRNKMQNHDRSVYIMMMFTQTDYNKKVTNYQPKMHIYVYI